MYRRSRRLRKYFINTYTNTYTNTYKYTYTTWCGAARSRTDPLGAARSRSVTRKYRSRNVLWVCVSVRNVLKTSGEVIRVARVPYTDRLGIGSAEGILL